MNKLFVILCMIQNLDGRPNTKQWNYEQILQYSLNSNSIKEYDYEKLLIEYEEEMERNFRNSYNKSTTKADLLMKMIKQIILINKKPHGPWTNDTTHNTEQADLYKGLWRIFKIWSLIYLFVAIPLWCTKGWCCCCLFCNTCKPQKTMEKAKKYLVLNPPGVLKWRQNEIYYSPTDYEREAYNKFEHILRTI